MGVAIMPAKKSDKKSEKKKPEMLSSIKIDPDTHHKVKILAALRKQEVNKYLSGLIDAVANKRLLAIGLDPDNLPDPNDLE